MKKLFKNIGTWIKNIPSNLKNLVNTRSKRLNILYDFFDGVETIVAGKVDDGVIAGVAVVNPTLAVTLTGVDTAAKNIVPEVLDVLEIMIAEEDAPTFADKLNAICKVLKKQNNIEITDRIKSIVTAALENEGVETDLEKINITIKEAIQLKNTKNLETVTAE